MPVYNTITFQNDQRVRVIDDCNHMVALDLISVLTNNDRKKASQTLARVSMRDDTSSLITLRRSQGKKNPRKLISFSNAIQLLLILPKRTASLQTRRIVAGILADFFEKSPPSCECLPTTPSAVVPDEPTTFENFAIRQAHLSLQYQAADLERRRMQMPLEQLSTCITLMQKCGPLLEEDIKLFRNAITDHIINVPDYQKCAVLERPTNPRREEPQ